MKKNYFSFILMTWTLLSFAQWTTISNDASGDSTGMDATLLEYQYNTTTDQVLFRFTVNDLSTYSSGPAADFSFHLPNGLDSGANSGNHWSSSSPVHKTATIYCNAGGTAPSSYTYPNDWPNEMFQAVDNTTLCSNCINIFTDVTTNQIIYTFDRTDIISNSEAGGSNIVTIGIVANVGHDVGWDDSVTHVNGSTSSSEFTLDLSTVLSTGEFAITNISLFTNPVLEEVIFNNNRYNARKAIIVDLAGHIIKEFILNNDENRLPVSNLSNGMYFLMLSKNGKYFSNSKFIKK